MEADPFNLFPMCMDATVRHGSGASVLVSDEGAEPQIPSFGAVVKGSRVRRSSNRQCACPGGYGLMSRRVNAERLASQAGTPRLITKIEWLTG